MVNKIIKDKKAIKVKKNIIKLITLVILTFSTNINLVYADSLTLNDLYEQLENSEIYIYLKDSNYDLDLGISENKIFALYFLIKPNPPIRVMVPITFSYNEETDILSYKYDSFNEGDDLIFESLTVEGLIISQVLFVIAENNRVTFPSEIDESKLTLEENGIEAEMIEVKSGNETVKGYKSLSVKLNDLNFENQNSQTENDDNQTENGNSQNDNNQTGSDTENGNQQSDNENKVDNNENIENPKTGNFISMVTLIIAAIISIFIIVIANKKTVFKKI